MQSFKDQVILITGGAAGIGQAAALRFAEAGARVVVTGRREPPLRDLAAHQPLIDYVIADAADADDARATIATVIERWGRLDLLVNNAGAGALLPLADAGAEQVRNIFAVNVIGPSLLATAALPHLRASRGAIINISSTFGHKAGAGLSHYAASKAALEHLTRCWALELAPAGVRVNAVAAGPTETAFLAERMQLTPEQIAAVKQQERERIPLGRRGEPDDVAQAIVWLASSGAHWITGQILTADGGLNIA
ncbi:SDR family NAD(P)-dependent oxidoreductase [Duganella callida]|uniref:SDR family oxidoreductase n=1 Tax=Duganella callida TaxID=2561932 RepID=A0A4Y9S709_9BURK|nr:SDR family oxidoreductase [Duganella callida]TFW17204.1 SDR family oxidoreductase [Duganella callida]